MIHHVFAYTTVEWLLMIVLWLLFVAALYYNFGWRRK